MINLKNAEQAASSTQSDPRSGSSLVPMLIGGLVLIVIGMIGVMALS